MPRKRTPEHLMTPKQIKRRIRNERYRSIKRDGEGPASQSALTIETAHLFETPLRLVSKMELPGARSDESEHRSAAKAKSGSDQVRSFRTETPPNLDITWSELFQTLVKPASVLLLACITVLSGYLIYQGVIFFSAIDPKPISAFCSAVISELISFLCAACFALAGKFSHRAISLVMLLMSILGLGVFMHNSISTQVTQGSGRFERLSKGRELTLASIAAQSASLISLPEGYVTKRQDLAAKIGFERENLAKIDREIDALESGGGDLRNTDLSYAVWIRIAAMLLNAYLIHLFFSAFPSRSTSSRLDGEHFACRPSCRMEHPLSRIITTA